MYNVSEEFKNKLTNISVVITDVDGVLTDGGLYYSADGLIQKKFNVKDGMGVHRLRDNGIYTGIISTDTSDIIKVRAERLKMDFCYTGIWTKEEKVAELCEKYNITKEQIAFIGDDINDLGIINEVGLSFAPLDAISKIKDAVDIVLTLPGGKGVFRELAELILSYK